MYKLNFLCVVMCFVNVLGQYEDKRCFCICPTIDAVFNNSQSKERQFFKDSLPASKCNCYGLIIPKLGNELKGRESQFCHRCECKFQTRNTSVIMVVVIGVLWVLTLLSVYMGFLFCLDPLLHSKKIKTYYDEDKTESDESRNLLQNDGEFED